MDNLFFFLWICKTWPFISTTHTHARAHTSKQQLLEAIVHFFAKNNTQKKKKKNADRYYTVSMPLRYQITITMNSGWDYVTTCGSAETVNWFQTVHPSESPSLQAYQFQSLFFIKISHCKMPTSNLRPWHFFPTWLACKLSLFVNLFLNCIDTIFHLYPWSFVT